MLSDHHVKAEDKYIVELVTTNYKSIMCHVKKAKDHNTFAASISTSAVTWRKSLHRRIIIENRVIGHKPD